MCIYIYHDKRTHCIYEVERNRSELNSSNEPVWGRRQIWDLQIWWTQSLFETTAAIHMLDSTNLKCSKWTNFIFRVQQATPHIVLSNWSLESHGLKRIWVKSAVYSWNLPPLDSHIRKVRLIGIAGFQVQLHGFSALLRIDLEGWGYRGGIQLEVAS